MSDIGGGYDHQYSYDKLNRLLDGHGSWNDGVTDPGSGDYTADYNLHSMEYDDMHRITRKHQSANKNDSPHLDHTYDRSYVYNDPLSPRAVSEIYDNQWVINFAYDSKGNMINQNKTYLPYSG